MPEGFTAPALYPTIVGLAKELIPRYDTKYNRELQRYENLQQNE
jgi:hypothetical protein